MKTLLLLAVLAALMITGSLILAKDDFMVKCCVNKKCSTMTKPQCQKANGYVVQNCGQCK